MKRLTLILAVWLFATLTALTLLPAPEKPSVARAESEVYAVAETADVWFYKSENVEDKLFCIPRTYYVKVVSRGEQFSLCEYLKDNAPYCKVLGYCLTNSLTFVDFIPARPYLYREVTVEYVLPGAALGDGKFAGKTETFVYYGTRYEAGQLYFYVGKNGEFDYIPADEELSFELNTDYLPAPEETTNTGGKSSEGLSAVQIVLITLSAVAVLVVAVFVARGKKSAPPENFEP